MVVVQSHLDKSGRQRPDEQDGQGLICHYCDTDSYFIERIKRCGLAKCMLLRLARYASICALAGQCHLGILICKAVEGFDLSHPS